MVAAHYELYVAQCHRHNTDPLHWMLMIAKAANNNNKGKAKAQAPQKTTWYHSRDGDFRTLEGYKVTIEPEKRGDSKGIDVREKIGTLSAEDVGELDRVSLATEAGYCQGWVVEVLKAIEQKGLVKKGTAAKWEVQVEPRPEVAEPPAAAAADAKANKGKVAGKGKGKAANKGEGKGGKRA